MHVRVNKSWFDGFFIWNCIKTCTVNYRNFHYRFFERGNEVPPDDGAIWSAGIKSGRFVECRDSGYFVSRWWARPYAGHRCTLHRLPNQWTGPDRPVITSKDLFGISNSPGSLLRAMTFRNRKIYLILAIYLCLHLMILFSYSLFNINSSKD